MTRTLTPIITLATIVLVGCEPGAPDQISYQRDVAPIIKANCLRCHAYPAIMTAPARFRFDSLEATEIVDPMDPADPTKNIVLDGVAAKAAKISERIVDPLRPMPPLYPLDDYQLEILTRWTEPATRDPQVAVERGEPRPDNHLPTIEVLEISVRPGGVTMTVRVADEDDEVVAGTLRVGVPLGNQALVGTLRSGVQELSWQAPVPGTYSFTADLDDGGAAERTPVFVVGGVEVP